MPIPIPKGVPDAPEGGYIYNSFLQSQLNNAGVRKAQAEAKYAPYNEYANALSKIAYANLTPYQIQATVLSNPLLWAAMKDNPQMMSKMMGNFVNSVPRADQISSIGNLPQPVEPSSNGLLGLLVNRLTGKGDQNSGQNPLAATGENTGGNPLAPPSDRVANPLLPSIGGGAAGVAGKMTAPYTQSPYKEGSLIPDPNNPGGSISVPTGKTATALQSSINAGKRVLPQLKRLSKEAAPFLSYSGKTGLKLEQFWNQLFPNKAGELPAKWAKFQSTLKSAPESLLKAYGLNGTNETLTRMEETIHPVSGETADQYEQRILQTLEEIKNEQVGTAERQLSTGFNIVGEEPGSSNSNTDFDVAAEVPPKGSGATLLAKNLELPEFESRAAFLKWYNAQPAITQSAVKIKLGGGKK